MRPSTICNFLFLIVCIFLQTNLFAQSPSLVNFRGQLLNSSGQPVTSTVSIDLRVFPTQTGGAQLYLENVGSVEVRNGQYAFQFGTNGSPDFSAVIKQNAETWVELTLDGDVLPRQRFVSVPYALSAGSSQITAGSITREMLAPGVLVDGNGSYNTSQSGGNSISNPFGWDGVPVLGEQAEYVVPTGKVLILLGSSGVPFKIEDNTTSSNVKNIRSHESPASFLPSGTKILGGSSGWSAFLINEKNGFIPIVSRGENYTVAQGKVLVITSSTGTVKIPSVYGDQQFRGSSSPPSIVPSGTIINALNPEYGWSGYLTDLGNLANLGSSSISSPIANSSITRDMLSQEVLDEINASITPDRLSPEVSQKLNSSSQVSGQIISIPEGVSSPAGYSKVQEGRIEWKVESMGGPYSWRAGNAGQGKLISVNNILHCFVFYGDSRNTINYYDENASNWKYVASQNSPSDHTNGRAGAMNNKIYVVGGTDKLSVSVYDTILSTWQNGPSLPQHNSPGPPYVESVGNRLYVFLYIDSDNTRAFELDSNETSWTELSVNKLWAYGGASVVYNNEIYFISGQVGASLSTTVQKFNSIDGQISLVSSCPVRGGGSAFVLNDYIYFVGQVGEFYRYDPRLNKWRMEKNHPFPPDSTYVFGHMATTHNSKAWITGGHRKRDSDGNAVIYRTTETYTGTIVPALYSYTDTNASSGSGGGSSIPAPGSVTTSMLNETILKYLKPEISQQPSLNGPPINGQSISLSALTEGKYRTYQWKKNGINLNGETNATLTISDTNASQHDGNYTLVVTNDFGSVETTTISVNVLVQASTHTADLNASVQLEMLWVDPGTFTMGSPTTEAGRQADREDEHNVTLTQGFYLGKYEVTQAQYEAVMTGNTDSLSATPSTRYNGNPDRPVETVSWADAQIFLTRLNAQQSANIPAGWSYVLPTEAEWEYACRAGTTTTYSWGATIATSNANYSTSGLSQTSDAGNYAANPWGFFDMHGNVYEWTADWYAVYSSGAQTDPTGPASGSFRVRRGGSWDVTGTPLRSAYRNGNYPSSRYNYIGFRVGFKQQ